MNIYRTLDKKETKEFQQWAKENYVPGTVISPVWHPVIKEECKKMNTKAQQEVEEQPEKQLF